MCCIAGFWRFLEDKYFVDNHICPLLVLFEGKGLW